MANLPVPATREQSLSPKQDEFRDALAWAIFQGQKPGEIARRMAPHDKMRQRTLRARVRRMIKADPDLQKRVGGLAQAELIMGLGTATRGLIRAASRGRTEAIKLVFEATGFHTSLSKHEHSGELQLTLNIPRPPVLDDEGRPEKVVDAEVVDEAGTG